MTSIGQNESSYDTGSRPFRHDVSRGKWNSFKDFYCASICNAFGVKYFSLMALLMIKNGGVLFLIPYTIGLMLFSIPVFFIQSFLGQFSGSGFISAFRIAPLFKGVGYVILSLNIWSACYFAVTAAFPFIFLMASFQPTLPWMACDNSWNTANCTNSPIPEEAQHDYYDEERSSAEYFHYAICQYSLQHELRMSWRITVSIIIIWFIIGAIVINGIEMIGTILRYFTMIIITCLMIVFIRVLFVENAMTYILEFFALRHHFDIEMWLLAPAATTLGFGSGWGTILTMSSFNNFKENAGRYSILISFSHLFLLLICGILMQIIDSHLTEIDGFYTDYYFTKNFNIPFIAFPYFFGQLGASNFWSIIFFLALFLGDLSGSVIQIFSILTAAFDEYEPFRLYKKGCTITLLIFLMMFSFLFTFNDSIHFIIQLLTFCEPMSFAICFIELMMVVWVYGRLKFQRDIKFMTNHSYSTFVFNIFRFVAPVLLLWIMFISLVESFIDHAYMEHHNWILPILKCVSFLIVPVYMMWKLSVSTGGNRFMILKRLCRPTDWYPADPVHRRNYDDLLASTTDISDQLVDDTNLDGNEYDNNI